MTNCGRELRVRKGDREVGAQNKHEKQDRSNNGFLDI
jgi:hypothetical protein